MRAGAFSEKRVIDLLNRGFVSYFFNRGGPGAGKNAAALTFVGGQTRNQYAYLAAFDPKSGKLLGETEVYAGKDAVFKFLRELLSEHPDYGAADPGGQEPSGSLRAGQAFESLGEYEKATQIYSEMVSKAGGGSADSIEDSSIEGSSIEDSSIEDSSIEDSSIEASSIEASLGLLRIARYERGWKRHALLEESLRGRLDDAMKTRLAGDLGVEQGYRLLGAGRYAEARKLLQPLALQAHSSRRLAEIHFAAGVACWFLQDKDWAKFHWCWVADNLPEDPVYMRARIAAAADAMPYPNPELGGYKARVGSIGTRHIVDGVAAAMVIYRALKPAFEAGRFTDPVPRPSLSRQKSRKKSRKRTRRDSEGGGAETRAPSELVRLLTDGNAHSKANNVLVDRLVELGEASIDPLMKAIRDRRSSSRGYSAWALAQVLRHTGAAHSEARKLLDQTSRDRDPYVRALCESGLRSLSKAP